ncbi:hypothetical protein AKJ49_00995 [candidate division MSBL1 archaeon SCGC-AAA382A03]|uniref:PKD domain-containing protein n=1 Tax=candidate division MSBL1 archaeon SCGC-AAA382A03 TaxID=1698278 RepID=A0A133VG00_9EURY|nr:hypothetical protein AKJ49_00995 [candidate division MSBL1 archaeon SCGC-AAA382A03]
MGGTYGSLDSTSGSSPGFSATSETGDHSSHDVTVELTVTDDDGATDTDTATVTVNSQNDPPTTSSDSITTCENTSGSSDVLFNDSDPEGDPLVYSNVSISTSPSHGSASVDETAGEIVYSPNPNYNGSDSFEYQISDGNGGISTETVSVTVNNVSDSPTALFTHSSSDKVLDVDASNSSDIDGSISSYEWKWSSGDSFSSGTETDSHTYSSGGEYTVELRVTDDDGATDTYSQTVTINKDPDAPSSPSPSDGVKLSETSSVTLEVTVTDPDGDSMDVAFYDSGGTQIGTTQTGVSDGGTTSVSYSVSAGNSYDWYAVATDDEGASTQSSTWSFTVKPPVDESKEEDEITQTYNLLPILIVLSLSYSITLFLSKRKSISTLTHKRIWNVFLLITFLASGILGILLVIRINFGFVIPLPFNILFWHVEAGIAMFVICIFHIIERFRALLWFL